MMVIGMIYSVKFHQKFNVISMVMKLRSQKSFFVYKFSLPPIIPPLPMVMHRNEICEEIEMIEVGQL